MTLLQKIAKKEQELNKLQKTQQAEMLKEKQKGLAGKIVIHDGDLTMFDKNGEASIAFGRYKSGCMVSSVYPTCSRTDISHSTVAQEVVIKATFDKINKQLAPFNLKLTNV